MHASGKIFMGIGLVLVLIGGGMFAWGSLTVDAAVDDLVEKNWALEEVTTGTIEIVDEDGEGQWGFVIYIEGEYIDSDDDDYWDFCDSYNQSEGQTDFTITHSGDSNNSFSYDCYDYFDTEDNGFEYEEGGKSLVVIGKGGQGYTNGTATVTCATTCWVDYSDESLGEDLEDLGEAASGILSMLGSTCFFIGGCCALILGLILGLTINDKTQTVIVQGGGGGQMVGTPVVAAGGAVPMMGAPMAAPVAAAPVAAPDPAQEYYSSLLAQGYDAQSASQYTSQHYPGFQG